MWMMSRGLNELALIYGVFHVSLLISAKSGVPSAGFRRFAVNSAGLLVAPVLD